VTVVAVAFWVRLERLSVDPVSLSNQSPALGAKFVGSAACAASHEREDTLWRGSHHQLAMQEASDQSVLGTFNNASFKNGDVVSTFFRMGPKFIVRTDGPDGVLHDYEIKFTFGVYPLQQYLIEMPGGRVQALGLAWDSRPSDRGGQRWFFLYPGQNIRSGDPLHWTGIDQNWNYMCADCHSTNVRKNYDARTRTFSTFYAEIDVSCEACHGPGSNHVGWARKQGDWISFDSSKGLLVALDERRGIGWSSAGPNRDVRRSKPRQSEREIQMCARCHSRRGQIHEDYVHGQAVGDDYRVALLDYDLYFPDGQIKAEDYEYGSFVQSRMFNAGVTCSDCHEPHSLKLRAKGDEVCLQCHAAPKYASPEHHFHKLDSAGARCVNCHMPERTYMVVDPRRDHSLRIPRPDLSLKLGVPNACTNCHKGKSCSAAGRTRTRQPGSATRGHTVAKQNEALKKPASKKKSLG
jgi:predicted CXXCH cytochrome family protein